MVTDHISPFSHFRSFPNLFESNIPILQKIVYSNLISKCLLPDHFRIMFFRAARITPAALFFVYCIPTSDRVNITPERGNAKMEDHNLVKNTLDQIPQANSNAKRIIGLVKEGGRITGYQLSDNSIVEKQQAVNMAKQGQIAGVGIAHRGDTEYLKSIPDGSENNNLGNLPSFSPQS